MRRVILTNVCRLAWKVGDFGSELEEVKHEYRRLWVAPRGAWDEPKGSELPVFGGNLVRMRPLPTCFSSFAPEETLTLPVSDPYSCKFFQDGDSC